jgi:hypothetical protein
MMVFPRRSRIVYLALPALAALIAGLVVWRMSGASSEGPAPLTAAAVPREGTDPGAGAEPPVPALVPTRIRARTHRPGARTPIPKLLPATTGRAESPPPARGPAQQLAPSTRPLTDRRENAPTGEAAEKAKAEIMRRLGLADAAANECLKSWATFDPTLDQGVRVRFTLDARGLDELYLEDRAEVPAGPLACLSEAIYQQDWSGLTESPLQITRTLTAEPAEGRK